MEVTKKKIGKIDRTIFIRAKVKGMNNGDAAKLAGSLAKGHAAESVGSEVLQEPEVKRSVIELMAAKRDKILEQITDEDIFKASLKDKSISIGILTEKTQLLKGEPTERADVTFSNKSDDELDQIIEQTAKGVLGESLIGEATQDESEPAEVPHRNPTEAAPEAS